MARAAITTKSIDGSSSSRSVSAAGTCGKRLRNPASTRGSVVSRIVADAFGACVEQVLRQIVDVAMIQPDRGEARHVGLLP